MFSDPQSITYAAVAKSLPAISRGDSQSVYQLNDSGTVYTLSLSHQFKTRNRCVARLQRDAYVADAVVPAQNVRASMTATVTLDYPTAGYTLSDVQAIGKCLVALLTDATILKLAGGET